jgi:polyisoprenoid-binding protein YceI
MRKSIFLAFFLILGYSLTFTQTKTWNIDRAHTGVIFSVSHMVISEVSGYFREFDGKLTSTKDDFEDSQVEVTVKTGSINTDNETRDKHLKSADFFDAAKFPEMTFISKSFKKTGEDTYDMTGDLTIKGTTKTITLETKLNGVIKDPYGNTRSGWKASSSVNRFDYGLSWNNLLETGGLIVGKEVKITINAEFFFPKSD